MGKFSPKWKFPVFFLFLILFSAVVTAATDVGTFKQWTAVELRHTISFNGTIDTTTANITVYDSDNTLLVSNQAMTKNTASADFNYTVPSGVTGELGTYPYTVCGYSTVAAGKCEDFSFDVTPSGDKGLLGFYFLAIILSYGVTGLGIYKKDITITLLGTFAITFIGIYMLFFGIDVFKNYMTDGFAWVTLGVAFYLSARMAHEYII